MPLDDKQPWPFDSARAALLVIDMQSDFVDEGAVMEVAMARHRIPAMRQVIELCRGAGVPVQRGEPVQGMAGAELLDPEPPALLDNNRVQPGPGERPADRGVHAQRRKIIAGDNFSLHDARRSVTA